MVGIKLFVYSYIANNFNPSNLKVFNFGASKGHEVTRTTSTCWGFSYATYDTLYSRDETAQCIEFNCCYEYVQSKIDCAPKILCGSSLNKNINQPSTARMSGNEIQLNVLNTSDNFWLKVICRNRKLVEIANRINSTFTVGLNVMDDIECSSLFTWTSIVFNFMQNVEQLRFLQGCVLDNIFNNYVYLHSLETSLILPLIDVFFLVAIRYRATIRKNRLFEMNFSERMAICRFHIFSTCFGNYDFEGEFFYTSLPNLDKQQF